MKMPGEQEGEEQEQEQFDPSYDLSAVATGKNTCLLTTPCSL